MRRINGPALGLVLAAALAACGGDDGGTDDEATSEYCTLLGDLGEQATVPETRGEVDETLELVDRIAAAAPAELAGAWAAFEPVFTRGMQQLRQEILDPQDPPDGMTREDAVSENFATFARAMQPLAKVDTEAQQIRRHARSECRVSFGY